ncbi:Inherit from COG: Na H antiporter [Seminavis robusta]|uniref:Inherit from COG: Na H antiporter n=1 Tax=Seminavis robusta TaxID=568900 RepID=A0A9N8E9A1_9STRA|nr:Inherit from COG: Na H antiporter [Seminavis robusta]|eukprot:Sro634_g179060.1 Inherit from COG: Na H antiporter (675) ;mRNA; r:53249-55458
MGTQMVELSLLSAVFVGACMVSGNIKDGFKTTLDDYILNSLSSVDHGYVYLFTLFLSGMVGMLQKSGGMIGFTQAIAQYAKSPRAGQVATFAICCCVFFDDYTNLLLTGSSVKPLTDLLFISREKIAFIVDATAAPLASLTPISSWVGFEVSLIQTEISRLEAIYGAENLTIDTSAIAVFLQSIKYRYYPIFMVVLIPFLIYSQRDFGPMLVAERKARVYRRNDGGDGRAKHSGDENTEANEPRPDTPRKAWNMAVPIALLVFFIFYLLIRTGDDGSGTQSFTEKIESSDSYSALLWGTMGATGVTLLFYLFQFVYDGEIVLPTWTVFKSCMGLSHSDAPASQEDNYLANNVSINEVEGEESALIANPPKARSLMSVYDSVEAFLCGMGKIFPALIVLTLAWASGSIMTAVGADRLFSRWITQGISAQAMPTISFIISVFMALATGSSWGTMTILFPLLCVPTYQVANGDPTIFYATVAGILSGSVAGDHVSPISDTTVISSMSCGCKLLGHVITQAPYATIVSLVSILFGTIPIGHDAFPNIVGILLGVVAIGLFVYLLCAPILSPTGRFDPITQLWLRFRKESPLTQLQADTIIRCQDMDENEPMLPSVNDDKHEDEATSIANVSSADASGVAEASKMVSDDGDSNSRGSSEPKEEENKAEGHSIQWVELSV